MANGVMGGREDVNWLVVVKKKGKNCLKSLGKEGEDVQSRGWGRFLLAERAKSWQGFSPKRLCTPARRKAIADSKPRPGERHIEDYRESPYTFSNAFPDRPIDASARLELCIVLPTHFHHQCRSRSRRP
jgi:hypothetical protein